MIPRYPDPPARRAIALRGLCSWPGRVSDRFVREDDERFMRDSERARLVAPGKIMPRSIAGV